MRTHSKSEGHVRALRSMMRGTLLVIVVLGLSATARADQLRMADGSVVVVDEAWEEAEGYWYRRGGVTQFLERARVKGIERATREGDAKKSAASDVAVVKTVADGVAQAAQPLETVWIHFVGGAKMEVDEASESADGVWYKRGNVSIFIARARVEKVERERLVGEDEVGAPPGAKAKQRERRRTAGSARADSLIRQNGARFGVDPYLVFLVMEHESHFNSRAVSPVGAQGLMQLMPGTAARFGVRNSFDPAQNVSGGTRYLKELLARFNDRVVLVPGGYNAGEGAVMKHGPRAPPYPNTPNSVRRITAKYQGG